MPHFRGVPKHPCVLKFNEWNRYCENIFVIGIDIVKKEREEISIIGDKY